MIDLNELNNFMYQYIKNQMHDSLYLSECESERKSIEEVLNLESFEYMLRSSLNECLVKIKLNLESAFDEIKF